MSQQGTVDHFAEQIILFINGSDPFPPHNVEPGGAMVYRSPATGNLFVEDSSAAENGRRDVIFKITESVGFDVLSNTFRQLLIGS